MHARRATLSPPGFCDELATMQAGDLASDPFAAVASSAGAGLAGFGAKVHGNLDRSSRLTRGIVEVNVKSRLLVSLS